MSVSTRGLSDMLDALTGKNPQHFHCWRWGSVFEKFFKQAARPPDRDFANLGWKRLQACLCSVCPQERNLRIWTYWFPSCFNVNVACAHPFEVDVPLIWTFSPLRDRFFISPRPSCVERAALSRLIVQMRTLELTLVFSLFLLLTSLFVEEFHMTKKCRWKIPLFTHKMFFRPRMFSEIADFQLSTKMLLHMASRGRPTPPNQRKRCLLNKGSALWVVLWVTVEL